MFIYLFIDNHSMNNAHQNILSKGIAFAATNSAAGSAVNAYIVPNLHYPFEALEPYIKTPTMKIHHNKNHATYIANINKEGERKDQVLILDLMADVLDVGTVVSNSGGRHYNHTFFWRKMAPQDKAKKTKSMIQLANLIKKLFGSEEEMDYCQSKRQWSIDHEYGQPRQSVNKGYIGRGCYVPYLTHLSCCCHHHPYPNHCHHQILWIIHLLCHHHNHYYTHHCHHHHCHDHSCHVLCCHHYHDHYSSFYCHYTYNISECITNTFFSFFLPCSGTSRI